MNGEILSNDADGIHPVCKQQGGYGGGQANASQGGYGGSNQGNGGVVESDAIASHGREHSLSLTLPPLATIWLVREAQ